MSDLTDHDKLVQERDRLATERDALVTKVIEMTLALQRQTEELKKQTSTMNYAADLAFQMGKHISKMSFWARLVFLFTRRF